MSGDRSGARRLASASVVYGLGSVVTRGIGFLLLPIYTRSLTTADFGTVAVAGTVASVLGVLFPLGLHGAVARFHYLAANETERRRVNGTLWLVALLSAIVMAVTVDTFGAPLAALLLPNIPFDPYLRLAIWSAFCTSLSLVPLAILQVEERPGLYVTLALGASLATALGVVFLAVLRRGGAKGYLAGTLVGASVAAVAYLVVALRTVTPALDRPALNAGLRYGLPLVPHSLASWVLELSDRAVLARYVPLADVGVYGIGYQLGAALGLLAAAFTGAWVPVLFSGLAKGTAEADRELARLATYYTIVLGFCALGWALLARPVVYFLLAPAYHEAYHVTLWVVAAYVLNGLYILPIGLVFWKQNMWLIPLVTVTAGLMNVGLNLVLVPRWGYMAAAWSTLACSAVTLALAWTIGRRQHPFPYEYRRVGSVLGLVCLLFALGSALAPGLALHDVFVRLAVWLALPPVLVVCGVLKPAEQKALKALLRKALSPSLSRESEEKR